MCQYGTKTRYTLYFCIRHHDGLTIETRAKLFGTYLEGCFSAKRGSTEEILRKLNFPPDMLKQFLASNTLPKNVLGALRAHLSEELTLP